MAPKKKIRTKIYKRKSSRSTRLARLAMGMVRALTKDGKANAPSASNYNMLKGFQESNKARGLADERDALDPNAMALTLAPTMENHGIISTKPARRPRNTSDINGDQLVNHIVNECSKLLKRVQNLHERARNLAPRSRFSLITLIYGDHEGSSFKKGTTFLQRDQFKAVGHKHMEGPFNELAKPNSTGDESSVRTVRSMVSIGQHWHRNSQSRVKERPVETNFKVDLKQSRNWIREVCYVEWSDKFTPSELSSINPETFDPYHWHKKEPNRFPAPQVWTRTFEGNVGFSSKALEQRLEGGINTLTTLFQPLRNEVIRLDKTNLQKAQWRHEEEEEGGEEGEMWDQIDEEDDDFRIHLAPKGKKVVGGLRRKEMDAEVARPQSVAPAPASVLRRGPGRPRKDVNDHRENQEVLAARSGVGESDLIRVIRSRWPREYHRMDGSNVLARLLEFQDEWVAENVDQIIGEMMEEEEDRDKRRKEREECRRIKPKGYE